MNRPPYSTQFAFNINHASLSRSPGHTELIPIQLATGQLEKEIMYEINVRQCGVGSNYKLSRGPFPGSILLLRRIPRQSVCLVLEVIINVFPDLIKDLF